MWTGGWLRLTCEGGFPFSISSEATPKRAQTNTKQGHPYGGTGASQLQVLPVKQKSDAGVAGSKPSTSGMVAVKGGPFEFRAAQQRIPQLGHNGWEL